MRLFGNYRNTLMNSSRRSSSGAMSSLAQNIAGRGKMASRRNSSRWESLLGSTSQKNRTNTLESLINTKSANSQKLYYNMKYHAGQAAAYAGNLASKAEDSIFAKAKENGDTSGVVSEIKNFVSQYNEMLSNLKQSSSRTERSCLTQLNSLSAANQSRFLKTGVTRKADGTLSVDEKKLGAADIETLESVWGAKGAFSSRAASWADSIETSAERNLQAQSSSSYSSLFNNYASSGNYFNFWR